MPKYSLLAASYITYLSEHPEDIRRQKFNTWANLVNGPQFNFLKFITNESNLLSLTRQGLPNDTLSLENGQIILNNIKVPLVLDPNIQASNWLKTYLKTY